MWFKSLHLYRLHDAAAISLDTLQDALMEQAFRPLGGSESRRIGWMPPAGRSSKQYIHEVNGQCLLSVQRQERLLPASVVKEEVEARAADIEAQTGLPVRRQEKQALKEQVYEELLPRAFVRSSRFDVWWDTTRNLIGINASSRARAEDVLDLLRQTLGSLKVTPLATKVTPVRAMTEWLREPESRPAWLSIGDQIELRANSGDAAVIRGRQIDLDGEEMQVALDSGYQATKLAMTVDEQVSLVLTNDLAIKSLRFGDALLDEASQTDDGDDPVLRIETDFALMAGALGSAIDMLIDGLGGEATPTLPVMDEELDVYAEATAFVREANSASVSGLQRRLKIGYNRAARLLEAMEVDGVVSPMNNSGARKVMEARNE